MEGHFEDLHQAGSDEAHVTILVHAETVRRYAEEGHGESIDEPSLCQSDPAADYEEFANDCGTAWLKSETLGGYILMTSSLKSLETKEKRELGAKLGVNVKGGSGAIGFDFSDIKKEKYESLSFKVEVKGGIPSPVLEKVKEGEDEDKEYRYNPSEFSSDYSGKLFDAYVSAYDNGDLNAAAYGKVINQEFVEYDAQVINDCGVQNSGALQCYLDFHKDADDLQSIPDEIQRQLVDLNWRINNPNQVKWPTDKESAIEKYDSVVNSIEKCFENHIPDAESSCENSLTNSDDICDACEFPSECELDRMQSNIEGLPDSSINNGQISVDNYARVFVGHDEIKAFGDADDDLCALTRVGGGFYSDVAAVEMKRQGSDWTLQTVSQRTKKTQKISAAMTCVPRATFATDEANEPTWTVSSSQVNGGSSLETTPMLANTKYAGMISGVSGDMAGGGEQVLILDNSDPYQLAGKSQTSGIWGRSMSFGLDQIGSQFKAQPFGPTVNKIAKSNGARSRYLGDASESFCFLTQVEGEFDGTGEVVKIEEKSGNWYLTVRAVCESRDGFLGLGKNCASRKHIKAAARCYDYDQTP